MGNGRIQNDVTEARMTPCDPRWRGAVGSREAVDCVRKIYRECKLGLIRSSC